MEDHLLERFGENRKSERPQEQLAGATRTLEKSKVISGLNNSPLDEKWKSILSTKSNLRLVVDLQDCIKARENIVYAQKVKLSNLKEMAKTVAYIQKHGYDTRELLENTFSESKKHTDASRSELKVIEERLRKVNEQIHYTRQYLANKSIYTQFCRSGNKGKFRKEYSTEISLYETARKFLKEHSTNGKLPSLKLLKAEKVKLLEEKKNALESYHCYKKYQKELHTACSNVDAVLGHIPLQQEVPNKIKDIL